MKVIDEDIDFKEAWDLLRVDLDIVKDYSNTVSIDKIIQQMDEIETLLENEKLLENE